MEEAAISQRTDTRYLGHMSAKHFLGGRMEMDTQKTLDVFEEYGRQFGLMLSLLRKASARSPTTRWRMPSWELTVKAGIDPRNFSILAFGGAGPMHAALILEMLDIKEVIVPANPECFPRGACCMRTSGMTPAEPG